MEKRFPERVNMISIQREANDLRLDGHSEARIEKSRVKMEEVVAKTIPDYLDQTCRFPNRLGNTPVLARGDAIVETEVAVEVRQVIKPAGKGDLSNSLVGFQQLPGGPAQPQLDDELAEGFAHLLAEKPTEGLRMERGALGDRFQEFAFLEPSMRFTKAFPLRHRLYCMDQLILYPGFSAIPTHRRLR